MREKEMEMERESGFRCGKKETVVTITMMKTSSPSPSGSLKYHVLSSHCPPLCLCAEMRDHDRTGDRDWGQILSQSLGAGLV